LITVKVFMIVLLIGKNVLLNGLERLADGRNLNCWLFSHLLFLMDILQGERAFLFFIDFVCGRGHEKFHRGGFVRKVRAIV
jgi:hypothetical protein